MYIVTSVLTLHLTVIFVNDILRQIDLLAPTSPSSFLVAYTRNTPPNFVGSLYDIHPACTELPNSPDVALHPTLILK